MSKYEPYKPERPNLKTVGHKLDHIIKHLHHIEERLCIMHQEVIALLDKLDKATDAMAARLQALADQIANGITPAEATDIKARLEAEVARLEKMGEDPNNPVPTP